WEEFYTELGTTGAGKTYTMLKIVGSLGVMVIAIKDLFVKLEELSFNGKHVVWISYLEVYNEALKDLLSPDKALIPREDKQKPCQLEKKAHARNLSTERGIVGVAYQQIHEGNDREGVLWENDIDPGYHPESLQGISQGRGGVVNGDEIYCVYLAIVSENKESRGLNDDSKERTLLALYTVILCNGSSNVLQFGDLPVPTAGPEEILVKVRAVALNPVDFKLRAGAFPHDKFPVVPGCDVCGVVEEVGEGVTKFKKGDEVYGNIQVVIAGRPKTSAGTLAQYTVVEQHLVAHKPNNLSGEEAASLPVALLTAQKAFDMVNFERGQSVFVVGGAGGVGRIAIQLAKHVYGASRIVSNASTGKLDFVKSLGADLVVDYTKQSYDQVPEKFDFVFDTI
ncbi:hypothetical protein KI387_000553, partial [Taxus chinensis]